MSKNKYKSKNSKKSRKKDAFSAAIGSFFSFSKPTSAVRSGDMDDMKRMKERMKKKKNRKKLGGIRGLSLTLATTSSVMCPLLEDYKMGEGFVDMKERIKFLESDEDAKYGEEFEALKDVDRKQLSVSGLFKTARQNQGLNRFKTILANEPTRFQLSSGEYINANVVKGSEFEISHSFIATQAPLENTENSFWDMVWESGSRTIVVLDISEMKKGKEENEDAFGKLQKQRTLHRYWPSKNQKISGGNKHKIEIFGKTDDPDEAGLIIRRMDVNLVDKPEEIRKIVMFHYVSWPDMGVPNDPNGFLKFVKLVDEGNEKHQREDSNYSPLILHCIAGVGRTGTFAAIFIILRQMLKFLASQKKKKKKEDKFKFNIFDVVKKLKLCRKDMVQTLCQYQFIHKVVQEEANRLFNCDEEKDKKSF